MTSELTAEPLEPANSIKVLNEAFRLLRAIGQQAEPRGVRELARETGVTKSTAQRILVSLRDASLVTFDENIRRYSVGPGVLEFAHSYFSGDELIEPARGPMRQLWEETGETLVLSIAVQDSRIAIHQLESPQNLRFIGAVGRRDPLIAGATGRALMIQMDPAAVAELVTRDAVPEITPGTVTDPEKILQKIEETRQQGWALSDGELTYGGIALSVPIEVAHRDPAALSLYVPESRLAAGDVERHIEKMMTAATTIRRAVST